MTDTVIIKRNFIYLKPCMYCLIRGIIARLHFQLLAYAKVGHCANTKSTNNSCFSSILVILSACTCLPIVILYHIECHTYTIIGNDYLAWLDIHSDTRILIGSIFGLTHQYSIVSILQILTKQGIGRIIYIFGKKFDNLLDIYL